MTNKAFERGGPIQFTPPAANVTTLTSGQPILLGALALVCISSAWDPNFGNAASLYQIAGDSEGIFWLTVTAKSGLSPSVNAAVNPGDKLYADGGSLDAATNVTYGFTIDKNTGGTLFGSAIDSLTTGTTGSIRVRLKQSP